MNEQLPKLHMLYTQRSLERHSAMKWHEIKSCKPRLLVNQWLDQCADVGMCWHPRLPNVFCDFVSITGKVPVCQSWNTYMQGVDRGDG